MTRFFLMTASILASLSVTLGAFASHALQDRLSERALEIWQTGTRYQMYHALALILVSLLATQRENNYLIHSAGIAFLIGIILFSGSLYALCLSEIKWLGAITPLGGVAFIVGWLLLTFAAGNTNWN